MKLVLLTALGVGGATMVGALIGFAFKNISHRFTDIILSFASGVMLAAAVLGLILPSVEYGGGAKGLPMTILGVFAGEVNERHFVTILEGLENRGFTITTKNWIADFEALYVQKETEHQIEKKKRVNLLKPNSLMNMLFDNFRAPVGPEIAEDYVNQSSADSCVYVLSRQAGEGGDRRAEPGDLFLTDEEEAAIRFCASHYDHFVLTINAGSSMDLSVLDSIPGIGAVVYLCQLGAEGGNAFADLLSGDITPSGKLSDTWTHRKTDFHTFGPE